MDARASPSGPRRRPDRPAKVLKIRLQPRRGVAVTPAALMMAVDPGRVTTALLAFLLCPACTSSHHFIDPETFYGRDAGIVAPPRPPASVADAGEVEIDASSPTLPPPPPRLPDAGCLDEDEDLVCDDSDRCPAVADQDDGADVDDDGVPDACDPCGIAAALALEPLFYFRFDEPSSATAAQNAGSANPIASYLGGATRAARGVTQPERGALHLSGENNTAYPRVTIANVSQFASQAVTLSVWLRTSQTTDFAVLSYAIASDPNHFLISFINQGPLRVGVQDTVVGTASNVAGALADGSWHHVVITGQLAGTLHYYVDAQPVDDVSMPAGAALSPGGVMIIGQDQDSYNGGFDAAQAFDGDIDELALYDRELDAAQIQRVFSATTCL
jgi:concanavalin A-like lectin/glucanase superfamily protein